MAAEAPTLTTATLTSREQVAPGFWCLGLRAPAVARHARAAHYVAIDVPGPFTVRLPLGVWTTDGDGFSLLFREWGDRCRRLAQLEPGEAISCIGPLGNEFSIPARGARVTMVAGGTGIVPFWLLARDLAAAGVSATLIYGARTKQALVGLSELRELGVEVHFATDDGSEGRRGNAIDALRAEPASDFLYGCGPRPMLRALCEHARAARVRCEISMEETFGCSLGTCWGCVVPVRRGSPQGTGYPTSARDSRAYDFARVCTDGTVFSSDDVLWTEAYA